MTEVPSSFAISKQFPGKKTAGVFLPGVMRNERTAKEHVAGSSKKNWCSNSFEWEIMVFGKVHGRELMILMYYFSAFLVLTPNGRE
jgi:hypothetical protein